MKASLPQFLGRYQILGELGAGGMAEILLARLTGPSGFERPFVLKRILPHLARRESFVSMFLDEARIVAGIRHRNVVQVHELVHEDGDLFMVMEYLEGESVGALLRRLEERGETLDHALGAYIVAEACAGLHAAHEVTDAGGAARNLVHRDVSPQNLFVTYDGEVKVLDFGIAKAAGRTTETETGLVKGKFAYMSPEQSRNQPLDRRSDIFSLGAVLFELTTGRMLFAGASDAETLRAITDEPIIPPTRLLPRYPEAIEAVCMRALVRQPERRYATAEEMRLELWAAMQQSSASGEPGRALAGLMRRLFADHIQQKQEMLQRLRAEAAPVADLPEEGRTRADTARARRRRRAGRVGGLVAALGVVGALTVLAVRGRRHAAEPAVLVSNLRVAWATPNSIRWSWDVNDAAPDSFSSYELVVGPTEADVRGRTARATIWDPARSPELGRFLLPRTERVEKVLATITDQHEPATEYHGQLFATDSRGRRSRSEIVEARTSYAAEEVALVPDAGCGPNPCSTIPEWFRHGSDRPYRGDHAFQGAVRCRAPACYENLRIRDPPGRVDERLTEGSFYTTAFVEFAVAHDSRFPSMWSEMWLWIGDAACGFECLWRYYPLTYPSDGKYRVVQIPLRALRTKEGDTLTYQELKRRNFRIREVNVGGQWTVGATVRLDEIRIRW